MTILYLIRRAGFKVLPKGIEGELEGIPYLVAEVPISYDPLHIQVDVVPLRRVGTEGKAHGVSATLGNAIRIVSPLQVWR